MIKDRERTLLHVFRQRRNYLVASRSSKGNSESSGKLVRCACSVRSMDDLDWDNAALDHCMWQDDPLQGFGHRGVVTLAIRPLVLEAPPISTKKCRPGGTATD